MLVGGKRAKYDTQADQIRYKEWVIFLSSSSLLSWVMDAKNRWKILPPSVQEKLLSHSQNKDDTETLVRGKRSELDSSESVCLDFLL